MPTAQSILVSGAHDLPFGLDGVEGLVYGVTLVAGLLVLFGVLCVDLLGGPERRMPWRAVWPGAAVATVAIGVVDYGVPALPHERLDDRPQSARRSCSSLIVLIWFYALAIILLGGGINALRFERWDTQQYTSAAAAAHVATAWGITPATPPASSGQPEKDEPCRDC